MAGDGTFESYLALAEARGLHPISGGDGEANPFEQFGLNADGTPLKKADPPADDKSKAPDVPPAVAAKLAGFETQLAALSKANAGLAEKGALLDKLAQVLSGDKGAEADPKAKQLWGELRDVMKTGSPAFFKLMQKIEADPDYLEKIQAGQDALAGQTSSTLNNAAHAGVMGAAKAVFRSATTEELNEIVLPFEKTISDIINANKDLKARFLSGDADVAVQIFNRLVKPHQSMRVRAKQTKENPFPKATPRGGAGAGGNTPDDEKSDKALVKSRDDKGKPLFDIKTPQGKKAFHRAAISRHLDRRSGDE